ncbi:MAG: amino acid adenylation domain-containing protein [Cyanobacteria bacterium P01_F01_bin.86]
MDLQESQTKNQCLYHWFESQVEKTPDAIAVIFETQQLSYQELNEKANQLARYLQRLGVQPEMLVGICIERSPMMIISMLAVLKSGGAYVPLDPSYPRERIELMIEDSQVPILLTQKKNLADLPTENVTTVLLDSHWDRIAQEDSSNLTTSISPKNLAYVIYTSGSTGRPKGVLIEHRSLSNFVKAMSHQYGIMPSDRALQFASISFDVAVEEVFVTLVQGATLVLRSQEMLKSIPTFFDTCQSWNVSVLNLPTAFWHKICAELPHISIPECVRLLIIGSERAIPRWLTVWQQHAPKNIRLVNAYGPTEATVGSTLCDLAGPYAVDTKNSRTLPIGKAIKNVQTYVLNSRLEPVANGVPGELYIAGQGLARGYLNRPELTTERFIFAKLGNHEKIRLYQTGDWVRYREDGNLEFLDRIDRQEKIRGFRIELSEIESVLERHPSVQQAIMLAWEDTPGQKRLVAYIVPDHRRYNDPTRWDPTYQLIRRLRSYLQGKLPSYMVPASFTLLETLPLTPNGKVDRRALPGPSNQRPELSEDFVAPLTPLEKEISELWSTVLGISDIGVNDNFFELGGDSLQTIQIITQIEKDHKVVIQLVNFFSIPTIAGLANAIQRVRHDQKNPTDYMSLKQLQDQVVLDEEIQVAGPYTPTSEVPKAIFLTGGTGFVGSFLLWELLQKTQASIYCLVRAQSIDEAHQKIRVALGAFTKNIDELYERVIPVLGDLEELKLGIDDDQWSFLTGSIESIYHCGANVNLLYPYAALQSANVSGTHEVLRLASCRKPKPVHYLSTLDVFESVAATGVRTFKEEDNIAQGEGISGGYAQSKWIAEQLMAKAAERGLPVCLYRPGMVTGHSQNGYSNTTDVLCRLVKCLSELQQAPEIDLMIDMTPIDYVSQAIVHLSLQPRSLGKTFHIVNPQLIPLGEIVKTLKEEGCTLKQVPYAQWQVSLNKTPNALSPLAVLMSESLSEDKRTCLELWLGGNDHFDSANAIQGLRHSRITCPPANSQLLKTYLQFFAESGFMKSLQPALS